MSKKKRKKVEDREGIQIRNTGKKRIVLPAASVEELPAMPNLKTFRSYVKDFMAQKDPDLDDKARLDASLDALYQRSLGEGSAANAAFTELRELMVGKVPNAANPSQIFDYIHENFPPEVAAALIELLEMSEEQLDSLFRETDEVEPDAITDQKPKDESD